MMKSREYKFHEDPVIKQLVRDQMAGYKKMNELVLQEQRENLPKMTLEKSKAIYEDLLLVWEHTQKQNPDMGDLERLRIQELVERRRIFDKIAKGLAKK